MGKNWHGTFFVLFLRIRRKVNENYFGSFKIKYKTTESKGKLSEQNSKDKDIRDYYVEMSSTWLIR